MDFKFQNNIQFIYRVLYGQISLIKTHNKVLVYYMSNCIALINNINHQNS